MSNESLETHRKKYSKFLREKTRTYLLEEIYLDNRTRGGSNDVTAVPSQTPVSVYKLLTPYKLLAVSCNHENYEYVCKSNSQRIMSHRFSHK